MATKRQWEYLRNLNKIAAKSDKGGHRYSYVIGEMNRVRREIGLPDLPLPAGNNTAPDEELADGLTADTKLPADGGATQTLLDI